MTFSLSQVNQAIVNSPSQTGFNLARPNLWSMVIPLCPEVAFYVQEFPLPAINLPAAKVSSPFVRYPVGGDKADFGPLQVTFVVNADYSNYASAVKWLYGTGRVDSYDNMTDFLNSVGSPAKVSEQDLHCDIQIVMLNSGGTKARSVVFHDAIITGLSGTSHSTTISDVNTIVSTATFEYSHYTFI